MKKDYARHIAGFTLIEILVVIFIISIVAGVALISLSHNQKKEIENVAHALASSITLAEEEALLRPATIGLALTNNSYQFFISQNNSDEPWKKISDRFFKKHTIPDSVQVSLKMQDKIIPLDGSPKIIFSQSGDLSPFIIFIGPKGSEPYFQIMGGGNGEVKSDTLD